MGNGRNWKGLEGWGNGWKTVEGGGRVWKSAECSVLCKNRKNTRNEDAKNICSNRVVGGNCRKEE